MDSKYFHSADHNIIKQDFLSFPSRRKKEKLTLFYLTMSSRKTGTNAPTSFALNFYATTNRKLTVYSSRNRIYRKRSRFPFFQLIHCDGYNNPAFTRWEKWWFDSAIGNANTAFVYMCVYSLTDWGTLVYRATLYHFPIWFICHDIVYTFILRI